jgi:hypothetical protein
MKNMVIFHTTEMHQRFSYYKCSITGGYFVLRRPQAGGEHDHPKLMSVYPLYLKISCKLHDYIYL